VISVILASKSNQKDIEIERLRISESTRKDLKTRQGDLIEKISADLIAVQLPLIRYGTAVSDDTKSDKSIRIIAEFNQIGISDTFEDLKVAIGDGAKTKIEVYLLGRRELIEIYEAYWQALLVFTNECSPYGKLTVDALHKRYYSVKEKQEAVLLELSKLYLGSNYGERGEL